MDAIHIADLPALDADKITDLSEVFDFFAGNLIGAAEQFEEKEAKESKKDKKIIIPVEMSGRNVPAGWADRPVPAAFLQLQEEEKARQIAELATFAKEFPKTLASLSKTLATYSPQIKKLWEAWKIVAARISETTGLAYKTTSCKGKKNHAPNGCRFAHAPSSAEDLQKIFASWKKVAEEIMAAYKIAIDDKESAAKRHTAAEEAKIKTKGIEDRIKGLKTIISYETDTMIQEVRVLEQNAKAFSEACSNGTKCTKTGCLYAPVPELVRPIITAEKDGRKVLLYAPSGTNVASCYHGQRCQSIIDSGKCKHLHKKEDISKDISKNKTKYKDNDASED